MHIRKWIRKQSIKEGNKQTNDEWKKKICKTIERRRKRKIKFITETKEKEKNESHSQNERKKEKCMKERSTFIKWMKESERRIERLLEN